MSEIEDWSYSPCLAGDEVDIMDIHGHGKQITQLERDLRSQRVRIDELEQHLQRAGEELGQETQKRGTVELDRDILIDALMEKTEELREREQTVQSQNWLLDYARSDAEKLASSLQETQKALALLTEYVESVLTTPETSGFHTGKKRKLSS